jgi:hypothetical protein
MYHLYLHLIDFRRLKKLTCLAQNSQLRHLHTLLTKSCICSRRLFAQHQRRIVIRLSLMILVSAIMRHWIPAVQLPVLAIVRTVIVK